MKKLFITLSLVALSLSMVSCDLSKIFGAKAEEGENVGAISDPNEIRIYSNAYDGYVNVRQGPSAKTAILGRIKNGDEHLVQLGIQGNWVVVKWYNTIGYVKKSMIGYSPSPKVYFDLEADQVQGLYTDGYTGYVICNNGRYAYIHQYGDLAYGTWRYEGHEIVLTVKYVTPYGKDMGNVRYGQVERYNINPRNLHIGYPKRAFYKESDLYDSEYCDALTLTWADYAALKKEILKYVKL